ncbi:MAG: phosphodiester glycosidase family protein [Balneolaceae bacterium]
MKKASIIVAHGKSDFFSLRMKIGSSFCFFVVFAMVALLINPNAYSQSVDTSILNWDTTEVVQGVNWYSFLGEDSRFESLQSYNALDVDLESTHVDVRFLWFLDRTALLSMVANQVGATAVINATYLSQNTQFYKSQDSLYQRITEVNNHPGYWMAEGAVFSTEENRFDIDFTTISELDLMFSSDIMSGGPVLIDNGDPVGLTKLERPHRTHEYTRHPRTAIAVAEDGKRLILFTVDGRAEQSEGLTTPELTELFYEDFNASEALNLDGGGTTTMWIQGETSTGVVNYPTNNRNFDHHGERWTGLAIALIPREKPDYNKTENRYSCEAEFQVHEGEEKYLYLGDQIDGLMDMPANQSFTLSSWVKPDFQSGSGNDLTIFNKRIRNNKERSDDKGYEVFLTHEGHVKALLDNGVQEFELISKNAIPNNQWAHVSLTLDSSTASLFVNGQREAAVEDEALREGFDNKFFLTAGARREWTEEEFQGKTYPHSPWSKPKFSFVTDPFSGALDELQVWHKALSSSEIQQLSDEKAGNKIPVNANSLISYWPLDEEKRNFAQDYTGNVHGTYMGEINRRCN